jgi:hypothetical protein
VQPQQFTNLTAPNNVAKNLQCAAKYGQAHNAGALFDGGTVANCIGVNSFSSVVNLWLTLTGNPQSSRPQILSGIGLGLPVNKAAEEGTIAVPGGVTASEFALGVGIAKGAVGLGTVLVGYYRCAIK